MTVEVDGQWGPYLLCNPLNSTDPQGEWNCTTGLPMQHPKDYPGQCMAGNFTLVQEGECLKGDKDKPKYTYENISLAECCDEATIQYFPKS